MTVSRSSISTRVGRRESIEVLVQQPFSWVELTLRLKKQLA